MTELTTVQQIATRHLGYSVRLGTKPVKRSRKQWVGDKAHRHMKSFRVCDLNDNEWKCWSCWKLATESRWVDGYRFGIECGCADRAERDGVKKMSNRQIQRQVREMYL